MTLDMIETFLTILKYRNISMAANELFTSQSTVSHRLQLLEEEVGVPLFIRHKGQRVVELTPGGEEFIPIAEQWMSLFRDTERIRTANMRQTLTLACIDLVNVYAFVPFYKRYIKEHPEVRLNLKTYHSGEIYRMMESRTIDLGYVYSLRQYSDIITKPVYREEMVVICHRDSPYHDDIHTSELPSDREVFLRWNSDFELWHQKQWPVDKGVLTVSVGAQISIYLDEPGRWCIAPRTVYDALKDKEAIAMYTLADQPPDMFCYEIKHRYPRASMESIIAEFQKEVREFIHESKSIRTFHPWMLKPDENR